MKIFVHAFFTAFAGVIALNAGESKALLYIDFVAPNNSSPVTITLSGTFNRLNAGTSTSVNYNATSATGFRAGISAQDASPSGQPDVVRFTALPTPPPATVSPGQRFNFNNPRNTNPFTGTSPNTIASSISGYDPVTGPFFTFSFGGSTSTGIVKGGSLWVSNNYTNDASVNSTISFASLTLQNIGFLRGSPDIVYTLGSGPNQEQVILRVSPVPGPLPILGAATAFGYSRRLRKRIRNTSKLQQA